jgi:hypothetical protein
MKSDIFGSGLRVSGINPPAAVRRIDRPDDNMLFIIPGRVNQLVTQIVSNDAKLCRLCRLCVPTPEYRYD